MIKDSNVVDATKLDDEKVRTVVIIIHIFYWSDLRIWVPKSKVEVLLENVNNINTVLIEDFVMGLENASLMPYTKNRNRLALSQS